MGAAVEYAYAVNLITEKGESVGIIVGIGEYVYHRASYGKLSRFPHKISPHESHFSQTVEKFITVNTVSTPEPKQIAVRCKRLRYSTFRQGEGIGNKEKPGFPVIIHQFAYCGSPLHTERKLITASFHTAARVGEKEYRISIHKGIEVRCTVFRRLPVGKNNEIDTFHLGICRHKPPCRQMQSGTIDLPFFSQFFG